MSVISLHVLKHLHLYCDIAGIDSHVVYPNGISCTLPEHLQEDLVHTIPGLQQAKLLYPGLYCTYMYIVTSIIRFVTIHDCKHFCIEQVFQSTIMPGQCP